LAICGCCSSQVPTASTVTCAPAFSTSVSSAVASAGSPAPWKVSATPPLVDGPRTISTAGPFGVCADGDEPASGDAPASGDELADGGALASGDELADGGALAAAPAGDATLAVELSGLV
jgi:hypothetical protein